MEGTMSCSRHYENVSPYLVKQQQELRNCSFIQENTSKIAYFSHSAGTTQARCIISPVCSR